MSKELKEGLKRLGGRSVDTFPAEVTQINKDLGTCSVNDGDLEYTDVRLASVQTEANNGFYLLPKVGSSVLVSPIQEDLKRLYVECYSEIEECKIKIANLKFSITQEGLELTNNQLNLCNLIEDLISEIQKVKVINGVTPNVAKLETIKQDFKRILKSN